MIILVLFGLGILVSIIVIPIILTKGSMQVKPQPNSPAVLVLKTRYENVPLVIDGFGNWREPNFYYSYETEVYSSCSVTFKNEMYVYGGFQEKRQVSTIIGCSLTRVASLTFDHWKGACGNTFDDVYLCFN